MDIKDAHFLVTGGSLGIGKAVARELVNKGSRVMITGRDQARLDQAAAETGAVPFVADVANEADVKKTYDAFFRQFDRLDGLINNAGIGLRKEVTGLEASDFEKVFQVNVIGAAMMGKQAALHFKEQNHGAIVNIGSTAALKGYPGGSVYVSSKFALRGMTYCWQAELRPFNVRVLLVNPSEVTTAFGNPERKERREEDRKLRSQEIAHAVISGLEMDDRGFIPELAVFATNPWET